MRSSDSTPVVSVIVPTYNSAELLRESLKSVVAQWFQCWEAIVVDNYSEDSTLEVVEGFQDERICVIQFKNDGVIAASRNVGIQRARGKYVAFLDADDVWTPSKLSDQVAAMTAHDDLVFVYSMLEFFGDIRGLSVERGLKPLPFRAALSRASLERENSIGCSSVLARRDVVRALGGFDEDRRLTAVEDYDLWLRLSAAGPVGFIPRVHGFYRVHETGISRRTDMQQRLVYLYRKHGIAIPARNSRVRGITWKLVRVCVHGSVMASWRPVEWLTRRLHIPVLLLRELFPG